MIAALFFHERLALNFWVAGTVMAARVWLHLTESGEEPAKTMEQVRWTTDWPALFFPVGIVGGEHIVHRCDQSLLPIVPVSCLVPDHSDERGERAIAPHLLSR